MVLLREPASIRVRLVLLVLAISIPAVAGLALQARASYLREEEGLRDDLRNQAQSLRFAVDAELDRRQSLALALAASPLLRTSDIAAFDAQARLALRGSQDHVILVDRELQYVYTALPPGQPIARRPGSLFVEEGMGISFVPQGPVTGKPALAVLAADAWHKPARFNVGVPFPPAEVQRVIARQTYPQGSVASVIDAQQRVVGRSRNVERWFGMRASHTRLRAMAERGESGFVETNTLDGIPSLTYITAPGRQGWAALVAVPQSTLESTAWRLALQAVAASAALLLIGLGVALLFARRVSGPVRALEKAAAQLLDRRVPEPLHTGVGEIDRVGAVLHDAGRRAREAEQGLERRVADAVAEARQAEASLFEARKHEAIGRLTGGVAHDFNNLLQTISVGIQVVQRSVPDGPPSRALQAALAACTRAADLVRQMLAFGRAQPLRPQPVDLADMLLRSRELTGKAVGERIELAADIQPGLPAVLADPTQLELALLNLVFNARDAMAGGGKIIVRARTAAGAEAGLDDAPFVRIDVQDTGHGMDADTLARVFEPYFTTKPVGAGSGLGLPQVQAFARQSGGEVRIASACGVGTTVSVFLPVAEGGVVADDRPPVRTRRSSRALRILMVEDDILVASVVPPALEHEGHRVTLCRTADEARRLLAQGFEVDVLFTDVVMPGTMTGLDLVAWCAQNRPDVPALVATGYSARPPEGVWKLLRKPYAIEDLLDALDVATADRQPA